MVEILHTIREANPRVRLADWDILVLGYSPLAEGTETAQEELDTVCVHPKDNILSLSHRLRQRSLPPRGFLLERKLMA
jgi:hypothetical protein